MSGNYISIVNHLLIYENNNVYIAFDDKTQEPYFHAKQLCLMLKYKDYHDALKSLVNKKNIVYLKNIVKNYKILYKNVQGHTKFINEAGLNSLIYGSKKKEAKKIREWITGEIMPTIRKYGQYKLDNNTKKQLDELNKLLEKKTNEIEVLKHNLKKPKFKKGKVVYLLRSVETTIKLDKSETLFVKFGRTKNMKTRKANYDTAHKNRVQVLKTINVDDAKIIEDCVIKKMEEYKISDGKEYFECSYNDIIKQIASCIKFFENKDIDFELDNDYDKTGLSRQNGKFDPNKKLIVKIINEEVESDEDKSDDVESDEDESDDSDDSDSDDSDSDDSDSENDIQKGGDIASFKYLRMKAKYLQLKFDLL
jgi:prophage antirepressor-like protein